MNHSGFSVVSLTFIIPLVLAALFFMLNINHKLDETLVLTNTCDNMLRPSLIMIQESTNRILDLNPSIKVLNALEIAAKVAIAAATASGNILLLPELLRELAQIKKSQKIVKSVQTHLLRLLSTQLVMMNQKTRIQFLNKMRLGSLATRAMFKNKVTTAHVLFPVSHRIQEKTPNRFLSEMILSKNYSKLMTAKIDFQSIYKLKPQFQKWFNELNETKGVCAWTIKERNGRAYQVAMIEGKY